MLTLKPPELIKVTCDLFFLDQNDTMTKFINELELGQYLSLLKITSETYLCIGTLSIFFPFFDSSFYGVHLFTTLDYLGEEKKEYKLTYWTFIMRRREKWTILYHSKSNEHNHYDIIHNIQIRLGRLSVIANQRTLLKQLHDKRICSSLLVPEGEEEEYVTIDTPSTSSNALDSSPTSQNHSFSANNTSPSFTLTSLKTSTKAVSPSPNAPSVSRGNIGKSSFIRSGNGRRDSLSNLLHPNNANASRKMDGYFRCPSVHSFILPLHDRVTPRNAMKYISSSTLSQFVIPKFTNMFSYRERVKDEDRIFYIRIFIPNANSNNNNHNNNNNNNNNNADGPTIKIAVDNPDIPTSFNYLIVKVYGVDTPGEGITVHLKEFLKNSLDDYMLNLLSNLLFQNPQTKLSRGTFV
jgi:hypothetical protein